MTEKKLYSHSSTRVCPNGEFNTTCLVLKFVFVGGLKFFLLHFFLIPFLACSGNGKPIEIYDGRKSLNNTNEHGDASAKMPLTNDDSGKGEIIYFRDSDDEMPDSDEDPDDDLDI